MEALEIEPPASNPILVARAESLREAADVLKVLKALLPAAQDKAEDLVAAADGMDEDLVSVLEDRGMTSSLTLLSQAFERDAVLLVELLGEAGALIGELAELF